MGSPVVSDPRHELAFETSDEAQTVALGESLARVLRAGDVVALEGDLGAGKTRLVRGLARGLGCDEKMVSSPTYVLAHEYPGRPGGPALVHVDAYRIRSSEELEAIGWDRMLDGRSVVAIEWPQRIAGAIPASALRVRIEHAGVDRRRVSLEWSGGDQEGGWATRLRDLHYYCP